MSSLLGDSGSTLGCESRSFFDGDSGSGLISGSLGFDSWPDDDGSVWMNGMWHKIKQYSYCDGMQYTPPTIQAEADSKHYRSISNTNEQNTVVSR